MKIFRWLFITTGVIVCATLAVNAVDNVGNLENSMVGSLMFSGKEKSPCPEDMVYVADSEGAFCIDKYEESPAPSCLFSDPQNKKETDENLALPECEPLSKKGAVIWRNIARHQAELACGRVGKRLPTNREWYHAALGTPDKSGGWGNDDCNVDKVSAEKPDLAGSHELCKSSAGAYDMIGNVWEWTEETVYEGQYENKPLPKSGYVSSINSDGMVLETDEKNPDLSFFNDYFWVNDKETRGVFRGGYWNSQSDAGQYAVNITVPPSFIGKAVGFRCAKDID